MNLWDKKRGLGLLTPFLIFLISCEEPNEIGLSLNPNENNVEVKYQELIPQTSTVLVDSIYTLNLERFFIGSLSQETAASADLEAYASVVAESVLPSTAVFDDISLSFAANVFYGDKGAQEQKLAIYQLEDAVEDSTSYYSFQKLKYQRLIGKLSLNIPANADTFRTNQPLDKQIGAELFDSIANKTTSKINEYLLNNFKGIAIVPDPEIANATSAIIGIMPGNDTTRINIHYHLEGETTKRIFELKLYIGFNYIPQGKIPGASEIYSQKGTGVYSKIDFTSALKALNSLGNIVINRADLVIGDIQPIGPGIPLPSEIYFNYFDFDDEIASPLPSDERYRGKKGSVVTADEVQFSSYNSKIKGYRAEISSYVNTMLKDSTDNYSEIVLSSRYSRELLNSFKVSPENIKLKVYYTTLNGQNENN